MDNHSKTHSVTRSICTDCGALVPDIFLSPSPETERFYRTLLQKKNKNLPLDRTGVDPRIKLCPDCRAKREQKEGLTSK